MWCCAAVMRRREVRAVQQKERVENLSKVHGEEPTDHFIMFSAGEDKQMYYENTR